MTARKQFTLGKNERLKSRKKIELLFREGHPISVAPYRVIYLIRQFDGNASTESALRFGVGVGNKMFRKAVERNRVKRLLREAYRLQKELLEAQLVKKNLGMDVFFLYQSRELPDFADVSKKVGVILKKLIKSIDESSAPHT